MFSRIFQHQTKTITWAGMILAVSSILSGFLGVVRDFLLAQRFKTGTLDVYFAAFKIPDFIYNFLILGGISVAFLPLFSEYFSKDKKEAWEFAANCLNVFLVLLILLCLLLFIFAPLLINWIAPGFTLDQKELAVLLTRLLLLSPILFGLSAILSGVLQYFNKFLVYGFCPILYNLGIIFGILFLAPSFGILGVCIGAVIGAFFHFSIQIPSAFHSGFSFKSILNFKDQKIKKVFTLMLPRAMGLAGQQINLIIITAIASTLTVGSIAIFNFANNIQGFPVGVIGLSFAIAAFPSLSKSWAEKERAEFLKKFSLTFRQIVLLTIPVSIFVFIFKNPIVDIILRHGHFSAEAAKLTSACLGLFALNIFFSSLILLLVRSFFALQDTKTPTLISVISVGFNIALSFLLTRILLPGNAIFSSLGIGLQAFLRGNLGLEGIGNISVLGLPLAISLAALFQFSLLTFFLKKRIGLTLLR